MGLRIGYSHALSKIVLEVKNIISSHMGFETESTFLAISFLRRQPLIFTERDVYEGYEWK